MKDTALVTGGGGFIGSHIVDALVEREFNVISLDNESAESNEQFYKNERAENVFVDICDAEGVKEVFEKLKPDYVFHLAAESRIQPTLERPQKACEVNFVGTCNLLQASRESGVKRFMYSSTSSAYGLKNEAPQREDMHRDCLNPYSVTKVAAEDLCKMYHSLWGVPTVIFRYFNVYGERQPVNGEYAPVVGIFLRQKAAGEVMTIVGDGKQRRDFTHVKDVVSANILAALSPSSEILGEIFNIGTSTNDSVIEIAEMIGGERSFLPKRPGEAAVTLADNSKARNLLRWKPTIYLKDWINENK
jgi:UDP-glucose 4-epimerase